MKLVDVLRTLGDLQTPVFETRDVAARPGIDIAHASTLLARLAAARHIVSLRRGFWAFPDRITPLALPSYLTFPLPSYVSLQSALYLHGMISQVPNLTYAVSLARSRRFPTPLGTVSIHHVTPAFSFGLKIMATGRTWRHLRRRSWTFSTSDLRVPGSFGHCRNSVCHPSSA